MTFGQILAVLLESTGVTRGQLAAHLGYDISYISRWVSGIKLPSVKNSREESRAALCSLMDANLRSLHTVMPMMLVNRQQEERLAAGRQISSEVLERSACLGRLSC